MSNPNHQAATTNNTQDNHNPTNEPRKSTLLSAQSLKIKQTVTIPIDDLEDNLDNNNDNHSIPWTMSGTEQEEPSHIFRNGNHTTSHINDIGTVQGKDSFGLEELLAAPSCGSNNNSPERLQQEKIQQLRQQQLKQANKDRKGKLIVDKYLEKHHRSHRNVLVGENQNDLKTNNNKKKNMKKCHGAILNWKTL